MRHIHRFYSPISHEHPSPLHALLPNSTTLLALLFSFIFTNLSNALFCCDGAFNTVAHLLVGVVALVSTAVLICTTDVELLRFLERIVGKAKME